MRKSSTTAAAAFAACCLLCAAGPQEPPRKDAQAAFEPRSAPGAGQKFLETMTGDWDVAKAFFPRSGEPNRSSGKCKQTMVQGGRFLQSDFTFGEGDRSTTGTGLVGYEPDSGAFTSVWIDSRQTRMSFRKSRDKFDGESIVLYSRSLEPEGKDARSSKTVTRVEDAGKKVVHRQYAPAPDVPRPPSPRPGSARIGFVRRASADAPRVTVGRSFNPMRH